MAGAKQIRLDVVMTMQVITAREDMTVREALKLMSSKNVHHLPVVKKNSDGGGEKLVGIVTQRDLLHATSIFIGTKAEDKKDAATLDIHLKGFMSKRVHTLPPHAGVKEALRLMLSRDIGCVPVVESGELKGIVTVTDMLKLLDDFIV